MVDIATNHKSIVGQPKKSGFSLIEIVMVLAIVGLFSSVAVSRYANSVTRYRADAAARRIVMDLAYAQQHACATSSDTTASFNVGTGQLRLIDVPALDDPSSDYATHLQDDPYRVVIDSVDFGGDADLVFNGFGIPDSGGFVQIIIGTELRIVNVDSTSGKATIQ